MRADDNRMLTHTRWYALTQDKNNNQHMTNPLLPTMNIYFLRTSTGRCSTTPAWTQQTTVAAEIDWMSGGKERWMSRSCFLWAHVATAFDLRPWEVRSRTLDEHMGHAILVRQFLYQVSRHTIISLFLSLSPVIAVKIHLQLWRTFKIAFYSSAVFLSLVLTNF